MSASVQGGTSTRADSQPQHGNLLRNVVFLLDFALGNALDRHHILRIAALPRLKHLGKRAAVTNEREGVSSGVRRMCVWAVGRPRRAVAACGAVAARRSICTLSRSPHAHLPSFSPSS